MKKRFAMIGTLGFAAALLCGNVYAQNNAPSGVAPADVAAFGQGNRGAVLCTAAINSDGSVAGGAGVDKINTIHEAGVGQYGVVFKAPCGGNIRVNNGWARWTQVDTLQFGTTNGTCTTADLGLTIGVGGIWVNCFDNVGALADRSFSIFVAR